MTDDEFQALLVETGHRHHEAYAESDGVDPEWALWYAGFLQARIWDGLGRLLSRSDLVYLLKVGDREARASDDPSRWPMIYTRLFREFAAE
jgi:NAD(P)H-hydrate epimerase